MNPALDRLRGHARPTSDLLVARTGRRVCVGLVGSGYVRLRLGDVRRLGVHLLSLAGAGGDEALLVECPRCGAGSAPLAQYCHQCGEAMPC